MIWKGKRRGGERKCRGEGEGEGEGEEEGEGEGKMMSEEMNSKRWEEDVGG